MAVYFFVQKVVCIFGLAGACRTDEFPNICLHHVKMYEDMILVKIETTKTKIVRSFTITGEFVPIVRKYMNLRPRKLITTRFFVNYQKAKCTAQVVGKNKFSKMPKEVACFLELADPEKYTGTDFYEFFIQSLWRTKANLLFIHVLGHSFRRTSATILANTKNVTMEMVKRHGGWKSTKVAEQYIEDSVEYKRHTGNVIESSINVKGSC